MVSLASRLTSKATVEAAAPSQLPASLQGALMAGEDDNPLFLGGLRPAAASAVTDAMGAAIATGLLAHEIHTYTVEQEADIELKVTAAAAAAAWHACT